MVTGFREGLAIGFSAWVLAAACPQAATLDPGGMIVMPGSTAASNPELAGTVLNDNLLSTSLSYVPDGQQTLFAYFKVQNRVTRSALDDTMIFGPRILLGANVTAGNLLVDRVEISGFGSYAIDASYRTDGLGDRGPTSATRSADGNVLDFAFNFPLTISNLFQGTHEESFFLSLKTDARAFENTGRLSIFARAAGDEFNTYRFDVGDVAVPIDPPSPVPLPASAVLMLAGLALLARFRTARR